MKLRNMVLGLVAVLAAVPAMAGGIDGKWNSTVDSPMGAVNVTFEFKSEGEKVTGTMASDFGGQAMPPSPISEGMLKGEDISFKLEISMMEGAPPLVIAYKGKLKGDELALTSVIDMGQGPQETELVAKRVVAKG